MDYQLILNNMQIESKIEFSKVDDNITNLVIKANVKEQVKVDSLYLKLNSFNYQIKISSVLTNGFQSWSKAYEYNINEKQTNIRLKPSLLRFIKSDFETKFVKGKYFVSNFFITFFEKLPALNSVTFISKDHIYPTTFNFNKKTQSLEIYFGLDGENINGELKIDSIYIINSKNYFNLQDSFKKLFEIDFNRSLEKLRRQNIYDQQLKHVFGWESWYNYYTSITEKEIIKNKDLFLSALKPFNINSKPVFQIDDGWEKRVGVWEADTLKFPTPLEKISSLIEEKGMFPGIWMAPLALLKDSDIYENKFEWVLKDEKNIPIPCGNIPLWGGDFYTYDLSISDARDYIVEEVKKLSRRYNFKFLKLDFLYAGLVKGNTKNKEHGAAYYYYLFQKKLIEELSDDTILLGCGAPLQLSYPFYPIMRIGADTREEWELLIGKIAGYEGRPSAYMCLTDTLNRAILKNTVYVSDPDVGFMRNSKIKLTRQEKLLINIINFIFGSQFMISDDCDDIDFSLLNELVQWINLIKNREFCVRRFYKKDLYFAKDKESNLFVFFNLSNKDYFINKFDLEKILMQIVLKENFEENVKENIKGDLKENSKANLQDIYNKVKEIKYLEKGFIYNNLQFPTKIEKHGFLFLGHINFYF